MVLLNIIILPWARRLGGVPDTTPDFLLNPSNPSRNLRNLEGIFRHPIKIDRELRELIIIPEKDTTPTWSGIIKNNTLFLRVSSLEYDSLKERYAINKSLCVNFFI
ncbi:hypothetical protein RirG_061300 [Rhizophagus irregularis DAOM 197198w]|uniref:Uncharacterized protein n=1 Tax=Rhizophagus irregularis (strain DAOM 197198w) TaxID=1432141 RepID=A0A015L0G2_RHIIW|nr:hypothetical protein RirG_061300 [Rhizophagus irregularis DAOM 197198w]